MTSVIYTISRYLIIILFACFVYVSFGAQRDLPPEKLKRKYNAQRVLLILIHGLGYLSIAAKVYQGKVADTTLTRLFGFYLAQFVYIIVVACILPRAVSLSRGINNCMVMFICIGLIMQTRLGYSSAVRQFYIILAGTVLYVIINIIVKKIDFSGKLKWVYGFVSLALLILVLVLATVSGGAKTYLDLGFITFQPVEFVKILFVLFIAAFFYKDKSNKTVLITGIFAAAYVLILAACTDLGGALILAVLYVLMVYAAKKDWRILAIGAGGFVLAAVAAYFLFSHVQVRVEAWLNPFNDVAGAGYQIAQSLFAIGTGGMFGFGLYGGSPSSIPEVTNDMIFSAISEELGVFFGVMLILLWLCFILMIIRVSLRLSNVFHKLVCFGVGLAFGVQVFLNIGGAIKFIPLTGVNLPFISSGGSSMLASLILVGMVQALFTLSEVDVYMEAEGIARKADSADGKVVRAKPAPEDEEETTGTIKFEKILAKKVKKIEAENITDESDEDEKDKKENKRRSRQKKG